jgi:hypothetical protein
MPKEREWVREEERERERERKREGERKRKREYLILKGMTVALAPFSYLVFYCAGPRVRKLNLKLIGGERKISFRHN